jgi:hypothetical protein
MRQIYNVLNHNISTERCRFRRVFEAVNEMPRESVPPNFACDECRARKFRCSKERPSCALCVSQGKVCKYSPRAERTPLTRLNLTASEERVRKLEAALTALQPDVDLETLLESSKDDVPRTPEDRKELVSHFQTDFSESPRNVNVRDSASPGAEEALPQQADGFDWFEKETLSGLADGMAALAIKPEGTGYLGNMLRISYTDEFCLTNMTRCYFERDATSCPFG